MKKLIVFIILFFATSIYAGTLLQTSQSIVAKKRGSDVCTILNDSSQYAPVDQDNDSTRTNTWQAMKFTLAAQTTITMYRTTICDEGVDAGHLDIVIMNHDAGNNYPDETSVVANSTATLAASSISNCYPVGVNDLDMASTFVLSSGIYWVVQEEDGSAIKFARDGTGSTGDRRCMSEDSGSTWTCYDNESVNIEVWGCN